MEQVADDVWQVALTPRDGINAWILGDVLVDAGVAPMGKKLAGRVADRSIAAHTLTHAHPDHVGGSAAVVKALGVPFWVGAGDADAVSAGRSVVAEGRLKPVMGLGNGFKPVEIARRLTEGDDVAGFTVLDVPGHSPGHIAFWRESDRVLVCGDVWFNLNFPTLRPGLRDPFVAATVDVARNHASQERLAALEPSIVCFGHGPVLRDAAPVLRDYVARRP
jgi:glyoxylase-like metal-dependent hydrolase (beta-lactamase superfamily II)